MVALAAAALIEAVAPGALVTVAAGGGDAAGGGLVDPTHTIGFVIAVGLINPWTSPRISDAGIPHESVRNVYQETPNKMQ